MFTRFSKIVLGLAVLIFLELLAQVHGHFLPIKRKQHGDILNHTGNPGQVDKILHHAPIPGWSGTRQPFEKDNITGIKLTYNSLGMRGSEIPEKTNPRVLLLGDSIMEADEIPFNKTASERLNQGKFKNKISFFQHGFTSWSPVIEFAWVYHFGRSLKSDRVYLFVYDNDFMSTCATAGDEHYKSKYTFSDEGHPLEIPEFNPGFLWKTSALVRFIDGHILHWLKPKIDNQIRLFQEDGSFFRKLGRIKDRVFHGKEIYPPTCPPPPYDNPSKGFLRLVHEKIFPWDRRVAVEEILLRRPADEWDATLKKGVSSAISTLVSFNQFLKQQNQELVVLFVPAVYDLGPREGEEVKSDKYFTYAPTGTTGLEDYLKEELSQHNIPVLPLKQAMLDFKKQTCDGCRNTLYFKHEGHTTANAHAAFASLIEAHLTSEPIH